MEDIIKQMPNDNKWHTLGEYHNNGKTEYYIDGKLVNKNLNNKDNGNKRTIKSY